MAQTIAKARVERLRRIPIFAGLSDRSLRRVLEMAADYEAPAGRVLIQPGREGTGLFVIEDGTVSVQARGKSKKLGPGEFFGEMALLTEASRAARVQAISDVRCLAIPRTAFMKMLENEPRIAVAMLKTLAGRLVEAGL